MFQNQTLTVSLAVMKPENLNALVLTECNLAAKAVFAKTAKISMGKTKDPKEYHQVPH
jgi:hypothetical protein